MRVIHTQGDDDLARVFVAELKDGARIEFVESVQPPVPRCEKWVLIVSTLKGCPVGCPICDAGGDFRGRLTAEEILGQVDYLVRRRFPDGPIPVRRLKVQLARMGEPALNDAVLEVLRRLPGAVRVPVLMPSLSTVAPAGRAAFFEELLAVKDALYPGGRFQLQFSIHTTDEVARRAVVPIRTMTFAEMARLGDRFHAPGDRKITLNFAPIRGLPLDPAALLPLFSPERFAVKLTPVNPTFAARRAGLSGVLDPADRQACAAAAAAFERAGYDAILSIGELAENEIGSNCGMYVARSAAWGV